MLTGKNISHNFNSEKMHCNFVYRKLYLSEKHFSYMLVEKCFRIKIGKCQNFQTTKTKNARF